VKDISNAEMLEFLRDTNPDRFRASTLDAVVETFQRWLHLPDPGALYAVLGTVTANQLDGDPVWSLLVGPPGGGKSELLTALGALPDVYPAATLTEAALLSGTPQRETAADAKGGCSAQSETSGFSSPRTSAASSA
jgi:hypothetical protein